MAAAFAYGSDTAAMNPEMSMAQGGNMPPVGSTTPATVYSSVANAQSTLFPSQISIKEVSPYITFRVRPDLSLEVTRHYTAIIYPHMENAKKTRLPEGWYLLRFVVLLPKEKYFFRQTLGLNPYMTDEERFVAHTDVVAEYKSGRFEVPLNLKINDITRGSIRCDLYVKIVAIDQKSISVVTVGNTRRVNPFATTQITRIKTNFVPLVPITQFTPLASSNEAPVAIPNPLKPDPIAEHLDEYLEAVYKYKPNEDMLANAAKVSEFAYADPKIANLKFVDWTSNQLNSYPRILADYKKAATSDPLSYLLDLQNSYVQPLPDRLDPYFARAICLDLALMQGRPFSEVQSWFLNCQDSPYAYLSIHKNIHVRKIDDYGSSATPFHNFTAQMIANFSYNQGRSTDLYFSASVNPNSLLPLAAFGQELKLLPLSVSGSAGTGLSNSQVKSGVWQNFKSFKISEYVADIPLERYRVCLAFEIDNTRFYWPIQTRGVYICGAEQWQKPIVFQEGYFLGVEDTLGDSNFSPQAVNLLFRGERDVNVFQNLTTDFIQVIKSDPMRVGASFVDAARVYSKMPGAIPGVISLPMAPYSHIHWAENPGPVKPFTFSQAFSQVSN